MNLISQVKYIQARLETDIMSTLLGRELRKPTKLHVATSDVIFNRHQWIRIRHAAPTKYLRRVNILDHEDTLTMSTIYILMLNL